MNQVAMISSVHEDDIRFECNTKDFNATERKEQRGGADPRTTLWAGGIVPYVFTSSFTHTDRLTFAKAVELIEASTCLKFVGRTNQRHWIRIERLCPCGGNCFGGGFTDGLGIGSPRRLVIGSACISPTSESGLGLTIHETLHALGVIHTQKRPDRKVSFLKI